MYLLCSHLKSDTQIWGIKVLPSEMAWAPGEALPTPR